MKVIYQGVFINSESIYKLKTTKSLQIKSQDLHITFEFKPSVLFDANFIGKEYKIKVVGYGNDGYNEGYKVEIPDSLVSFYKGSSVPHITTSISEGSSAKNTSKINFASIEPFYIYGKVGLFIQDKRTKRIILN